jgi:hypothetical protein
VRFENKNIFTVKDGLTAGVEVANFEVVLAPGLLKRPDDVAQSWHVST